MNATLSDLYQLIQDRKLNPPPGSYTAKLFAEGQGEIVKKVAEEALEVALAVKDGDHDHTVYEIGDLLYHLLVLMVDSGITLDEVSTELARRRK
jgi:phosphoribosyl-ATP pyrophosphohydrolase